MWIVWINFNGKITPMRLRKNRRTKWTEEERQKLKSLFEKFNGDIEKISNELRRGERSVRMNLFFMDLIEESEVDQRFWIRVRTKDCHVWTESRDILYRCRYNNRTDWVFVCGKCLNKVKQTYEETYQYGGSWKSKKNWQIYYWNYVIF